MRLIVTRPRAQALPAVQEFKALGIAAVALPLIGIEPLAEPQARAALQQARATLAEQQLVMFVSANAVEQFFAAPAIGSVGPADPADPVDAADPVDPADSADSADPADLARPPRAARPAHPAWPADTVAGSTGPGTTAALLAVGVPPAQVVAPEPASPRLDSEALWQQLRGLDWHGANVLIVRGDSGRDWLAETLRSAGARVRFVNAYQRSLPVLDADEAALLAAAVAEPAAHVWHFSSSEAARNLQRLAPQAAWSAASAFATHERIGEAVRAVGFGQVQVLAPGSNACVQAWRDRAGPGVG